MSVPFRERYQAGDSLLHRLDPRVKLVMTLALIVGIVLTPVGAWPAYPLLWALVGSLAAVGGVGAWRAGRLAGLALPFTLAAVTLIFTTPGKPIVSAAGLTVSDAGLARFVTIVLKSWLAVQVALLLSMTTHFTDLLWAMTSLHVPRTLVGIIAFMYRYLFTLKDEAQRLVRGRASRCASLPGNPSGGSLLWRAQVAGGMIGSLFLRSYERSERVYAAMLARGYRGELRALNPPPLTWSAIWRGAVPVAILIGIETLAIVLWSR